MFLSIVLSFTTFLILLQLTSASIGSLLNATQTCISIGEKISDASAVIYALDPDFLPDIDHWFFSSTQIPACVLEVGAVEDVATALQLISSSRTPFAVKSGGHASNPGFSSTTGVHISMARMKQVVLSAENSSVEIGMGMTWAGVYEQLDDSGVNVVGGRTPGPGVGGFTLGGGFSWKTNQYGLTVDNLKSFTAVLPNGTVNRIDPSQPDLFFALKGGLNRFGIVTSVEYSTHQQAPLVYGGIAIYSPTSTPGILAATAAFKSNNTDPKAQIITTLSGSLLGTTALVIFFYDGPTRPASFAPFDNITTLISTVQTQSFSSFVSGIPSKLALNARGTFNTLSTSGFTPGFLSAVKNETDTYGAIIDSHSGTTVSYDIEPFLSTYGQYASDSAFPHADSPLPLNLYFAWISEDDDDFWYSTMRSSVQRLKNVAMQEGIYRDDFTAYPNYAISNTTAQDLYGAGNAARLSRIRGQVDPGDVMELAGGFAI